MTNSTQKQMIILKTEDSQYFEEAHLILKEGRADDEGMVAEACRIISRAEARRIYSPLGRKHRPPASRMAWFFMGVATALAIAAATTLLVVWLF